MTHIAIFTGGLAPEPKDTAEYWKARPPCKVIAADSGFDTALCYNEYFKTKEFTPSLAVGDFDSVKSESIKSGSFCHGLCDIEECSRAKDLSDTEIALLRSREAPDAFITLVGGDGGRLDHLLAIYDTFSTETHADVWLLNEQIAVFLPCEGTVTLCGLDEGDIVSVARLSGERAGGKFETSGLVWGGERFRMAGMPSLSNWAAGKGEIKITAHGCAALVMTGYKAKIDVARESAADANEAQEIEKCLDFTAEADKMTHVLRRTLLVDGSRRENDAEHSWHIALMALVFAPYMKRAADVERAAALCVAHDLVEVYAGDTFAYDKEGYKTKEAREKDAADRLFAMLPHAQGEKLRAMWEEFEAGESAEAVMANCMDRLQPFLHNTLTGGHTWGEGKVKIGDVFSRMKPVKDNMPSVWPWVEKKIAQAADNGWLLDK